MKFTSKISWIDPQKQRQQAATVSCNHAIFIAKKLLSDGMQDVVIQVFSEEGDDPDDASWPPIDAE